MSHAMPLIHRTLDGDWAECEDIACELKFHVPDTTVETLASTPLDLLLPLFEVVDPPERSVLFDSKIWQIQYSGSKIFHREYDLPAVVGGKGGMEWWLNGALHREHDRPARIGLDGKREWYDHGKLHREHDQPASVGPNGTLLWYNHGALHREGGKPAVILWNGGEEYWEHGELIRSEGGMH